MNHLTSMLLHAIDTFIYPLFGAYVLFAIVLTYMMGRKHRR